MANSMTTRYATNTNGRNSTLLSRAMCLLRLHRGAWSYAEEGQCRQTRDCETCGTTSIRTRHTHVWQPVNGTGVEACAEREVCSRCNSGGRDRYEHDWGPWKDRPGWWESREDRSCRKCGTTETRQEAEYCY